MTAVLIGLVIWLALAVAIALFVARGIALGQNAPHMPAPDEAEAWRHFDDEYRTVLGSAYRYIGGKE